MSDQSTFFLEPNYMYKNTLKDVFPVMTIMVINKNNTGWNNQYSKIAIQFTSLEIDGHPIDIKQIMSDIKELKEKVNEIYYAPGMPGYIQAQTHFEKQVN